MAADPLSPDATTPANEARSDSGADRISFGVPGDEDDRAGDDLSGYDGMSAAPIG